MADQSSKPWRVRALTITASTNDDVRQAAEAGEAEGFVVHALKQTAGRGRHGRQWQSPEGNLYCSALLRPKIEPRFFGHYSFVAALALGEMVREVLPDILVTYKWPNDVLVEGKKTAGILLESGDGYLIIGIGLNIAYHPEDALYKATSLAAYKPDLKGSAEQLHSILEVLLDHLRDWHDVMQKDGFAPLRAAWLEHAQRGSMTVKLPGETLEGEFAGIDEDGQLRLKTADGERVVAAGDVFFL